MRWRNKFVLYFKWSRLQVLPRQLPIDSQESPLKSLWQQQSSLSQTWWLSSKVAEAFARAVWFNFFQTRKFHLQLIQGGRCLDQGCGKWVGEPDYRCPALTPVLSLDRKFLEITHKYRLSSVLLTEIHQSSQVRHKTHKYRLWRRTSQNAWMCEGHVGRIKAQRDTVL